MDKSVPTNRSRQQSRGYRACLNMFDGILIRLVRLFQLTEEERKEAGIALGSARDEEKTPKA